MLNFDKFDSSFLNDLYLKADSFSAALHDIHNGLDGDEDYYNDYIRQFILLYYDYQYFLYHHIDDFIVRLGEDEELLQDILNLG